MNTNLDKIALDLYGKIETRFPNIKIGDENAKVLSKKSDVPNARFFEFEYRENGKGFGTVAITLDEDDGIVVQISGDIADSQHHGAFKFIRSFRQFAKDRLLNFDVQNIGKDNLDKRDYEFQAKRKEEPMEPIMENKMFGTAKMSYQDLGEARLVVKHSQPINQDLAAGRTMHIESIYIENAQGERFKYPYKHLNGARALAEHIKAGGNPYDAIGQHISGLSEELAQLRKFKNYVGRNSTLSEAMDDINYRVADRIETVKKEVHNLQRPTYYAQFAESFTANENQEIPEDILNDWIDRLTVRSFNEDLKTAFPYIYRLIGEDGVPVKEISPDDLLAEEIDHADLMKHGIIHPVVARDMDPDSSATFNAHDYHEPKTGKICRGKCVHNDGKQVHMRQHGTGTIHKFKIQNSLDEVFDADKETGTTHKGGKVEKTKHGIKHTKTDYDDGGKDWERKDPKSRYHNDAILDPEDQFESFLDSIVNEDEESQEGENTLFSPNKATQQSAIDKFNQIMQTELKGGPNGINIIDSLKGLIDDPEFLEKMKEIDPDLDARGAIQQELNSMAKDDMELSRIIPQLDFKGEGGEAPTGGEQAPPPQEPLAPPPEGAAPPAPDAGAPAAPPAPAGEMPPAAPGAPPAPPVAESANPNMARMRAKFIKARECGAELDHEMDFGHKTMTLHDAIRECGLTPMECGFGDEGDDEGNNETGSGVEQMLKTIAGFWNREAKNFTIGGTRAKTKVAKAFKDGEFPNATEQELAQVFHLIDKMDPSGGNDELSRIKHLAHGHQHSAEVDEASDDEDFSAMMQQFMDKHQGANVDSMLDQYLKNHPDAKVTRNNTSSGTINGKSASYDDAMKQMPKISFGGQDFDMNNPDQMGDKIKGMMGGMMGKAQGQMPNQNIEMPGGGAQMNPQEFMKNIMGKINFGN